jgi:hypothetical protein
MPLPSSGPLSLNDIQTEFGGSNPIALNEYYAGGSYVPSGTTGTHGAVPSSGAISLFNFYGTAAAALGYAFTYQGPVTGEAFRAIPRDIVYNGSIFVMVGDGAQLSTSSNGTTWTATKALQSTGWGKSDCKAIAWSGSLFCVVGSDGKAATSSDGVTWTYQSGLSESTFGARTSSGIIWDGSKFVTIGSLGGIATSPDGVTWTYRVCPGGNSNSKIAFNGTNYVITGYSSTRVYRTTDLITYVPFDPDGDSRSSAIAWSGTAFLFASEEEDDIYSSTDGISWIFRRAAWRLLTNEPEEINKIYWSGTEFVIAGLANGTNRPTFATAPADVSSFTIGVSVFGSTTGNASAIVKGSGGYVFGGAVGSTPVLSRSTSLVGTYTQNTQFNQSSPITTYWTPEIVYSAAWNGSIYLITGSTGIAATSPDGVTWTYRLGLRSTTWGTLSTAFAMALNGSTFLVAGGVGRVATTTDGITWTYQAGLASTGWSTTNVNSAIWTGSLYVVIGVNKYATSPDGITWTYSATKFVRAAADSGAPNAMIWTGTLLIVGTSDGHVYTSTDATTGTPNLTSVAGDLGTLVKFNQFAWNGTTLVAATDDGIYSSTGAFSTWTKVLTTSSRVNSVIYNPTANQFIAVSLGGKSYLSTDGNSWVETELGTTVWSGNAYRIASSGEQYVVAGSYATIATSL